MIKSISAISILAIATLVGTQAFAHPDHDDDKDSKNRIEQSFDYKDFDHIEVVGVYNMDVKVGGSDYSIETSGRAKDMERMKVYLDGDTLVLSTEKKKKNRGWRGKKNHKGIDITITMPALYGLEIAGIGSGEVTGIDSDKFDVEIAGIGSMELSGRCGTLDADYAGMGDLDARDLKCENVNVDMSGMGSATVYASDSVDADMSGMGSIDVYGKPKNVSKSKSFMSSVDIH